MYIALSVRIHYMLLHYNWH
ncbi:hypothetical protein F383_36106 [Gossypium arboreum]|uniref:Uncharacterized protein n=1 Tax=Gossypium arboreum TaxID=29729 RepID=A0A0B0Q2F1_GOSAR|nr:hypothetical protein F383_05492 [Gossypium arboreum]KHG30091.1 hypothetical protein F383_36106 [Gossypium arboreum]